MLDVGTSAQIVARDQILSLSGFLRWQGVVSLTGIFSFELVPGSSGPPPDWLGLSQLAVHGVAGLIKIVLPSGGRFGLVSWPSTVAVVWQGAGGVAQYPPVKGNVQGLCFRSAAYLPTPFGVGVA